MIVSAITLVSLFFIAKPLRYLLQLVVRVAVCFFGLFAYASMGFGISLGANLFNATVIALLGPSGVGLLCLLQLA